MLATYAETCLMNVKQSVVLLTGRKAMNKHLALVRDFHARFGIQQPDFPETAHLSDMDIVMYQALLMDNGSTTLKAFTSGDLAKILAGLVNLAYCALAPIACRGDDVIATSVAWRQDGSVLSLMKVLGDKIGYCCTGETIHYSALYNICEQLARGFINADFDKALQMTHRNLMLQTPVAEPAQSYEVRIARSSLPCPPDLSEALYE